MKKTIILLLSLAVCIFLLCSCEKTENSNNVDKIDSTGNEITEEYKETKGNEWDELINNCFMAMRDKNKKDFDACYINHLFEINKHMDTEGPGSSFKDLCSMLREVSPMSYEVWEHYKTKEEVFKKNKALVEEIGDSWLGSVGEYESQRQDGEGIDYGPYVEFEEFVLLAYEGRGEWVKLSLGKYQNEWYLLEYNY